MRKKVNTKEKSGCLKKSLISLAIIAIISVMFYLAILDALKSYNIKGFNDYISWLSDDVDEDELLSANVITDSHFNSFKLKAEEAGFEVFDSQGEVNLSHANISLKNSLSLTDCELGAMINNMQSSFEPIVFSFLELTITQLDNDTFKLTTVSKYNLQQIKDSIGNDSKLMPSTIYLTSVAEISVINSRVNILNEQVTINQLDKEKNKEIVEFLKEIEQESNSNEFGILNVNNYIVSEIINKILSRTATLPSLLSNHICFIV